MNSESNSSYTRDIYSQIEYWAKLCPDKVAVYFDSQYLLYRELLHCVDSYACVLSNLESKPRRIALHYKNSCELLAMSLAAAKLGKTIVPLNTSLRPSQLKKQIEVTQIDVVVTSAPGKSVLERHDIDALILVMPALNRNQSYQDAQVKTDDYVDIDGAYIITLSSGSTGQPKPIVLSQKNKMLRSRQAASTYNVDDNDVILCASPFYHSLGQRLCFLPLLYGASLVLMEHFSVPLWLEGVKKFGVSFTIAVSSHLQALRQHIVDRSEDLTSLRCLVTSSAQIDYSLKREMMSKLGCDFHEMYGATEVGTVTNLSPNDPEEKSKSVGKVLNGIQLRILSESHADVDVGEIGEIACCSPLCFLGYDDLHERTKEAFIDGFFLTGDLGFLDCDGYLHFVSRKKDIIISGGINIVPGDIEDVLSSHSLIDESCVVAADDKYLGEVVLAICAVSHKTSEKDELEIRLFVNKHLSGFQHPKGYIFLDAIPLTPNGKPDKQGLREKYRSVFEDGIGDLV